jgi:hypothetical protein
VKGQVYKIELIVTECEQLMMCTKTIKEKENLLELHYEKQAWKQMSDISGHML